MISTAKKKLQLEITRNFFEQNFDSKKYLLFLSIKDGAGKNIGQNSPELNINLYQS